MVLNCTYFYVACHLRFNVLCIVSLKWNKYMLRNTLLRWILLNISLERNELMQDDEESQSFTTIKPLRSCLQSWHVPPTLYKKFTIFNRVYVQSNSITYWGFCGEYNLKRTVYNARVSFKCNHKTIEHMLDKNLTLHLEWFMRNIVYNTVSSFCCKINQIVFSSTVNKIVFIILLM